MNRIDPPGVMLYYRWNESLRLLTDAQRGRIFSAILTYGATGEVPDFDDPFAEFAWQTIRPQIDDDRARYARIVEKRREAANKRWSQPSETAPVPRTESRRTFGMPGSKLASSSPQDVMNRYL